MTKSGLFPKKDEIILTAVTALVVGGLIYQGMWALSHTKEGAGFQKSHVSVVKNKN